MSWLDYRETLGIGLSSEECFQYFKNNICSFFQISEIRKQYLNPYLMEFCLTVGMLYPGNCYGESNPDYILKILRSCNDPKLFIAYCVAIHNSISNHELKNTFYRYFIRTLEEAKIPVEIDKSRSEIFVYPKGVNEFDKSLVSEPLTWLSSFPKANKTYIIALKQYAGCEYIRDCADNFRKALEEFLQEFFENTKNLENNIPTVGAFLKSNGASEEVSKILVSLINLYSALNNKTVKHNDLIDAKFLEFLMYQTGLFIRMLIVVRNSKNR